MDLELRTGEPPALLDAAQEFHDEGARLGPCVPAGAKCILPLRGVMREPFANPSHVRRRDVLQQLAVKAVPDEQDPSVLRRLL